MSQLGCEPPDLSCALNLSPRRENNYRRPFWLHSGFWILIFKKSNSSMARISFTGPSSMAESIDVDTLINRMTNLRSLGVMEASVKDRQAMNDYLHAEAMADAPHKPRPQPFKAFRCYSSTMKTPSSNSLKSLGSPDSRVFFASKATLKPSAIETNKQPKWVGLDFISW